VCLGGTRMGYAGLIDKVYYKKVHFDLLYPVWFKKFILRIVIPVATWVQTFKKIRAWADPYGNLSLAGTPPLVQISSVVLEKKLFKGKVYGQMTDGGRDMITTAHLSLWLR